jgi:hypothetical protein
MDVEITCKMYDFQKATVWAGRYFDEIDQK